MDIYLKNKLLSICFITFWGIVNGQASNNNNYTLEQCVEIAIKNNPDVNNAHFQMETANVILQQAKGSRLPSISGNVDHDIYNGRSINPYTNTYIDQQNFTASYGLSASITLWNGSSIQNYIKQYALDAKASEMDVQQVKDKLTLNIILYYLSVLSCQEQLDIAKKQLQVTMHQVSLLETKDRESAIPPSDLYDMQGQLATDKLTMATTKNALQTAKLALLQLMNIPYSADMTLGKINENTSLLPYEATIDDVYDHAAQSLAQVKAAELRKQSTVKAIRAAKGLMLPTVSLAGGLYTNYSDAATISRFVSNTNMASNNYVLVNNMQVPVYIPQSNYQTEKLSYGTQWKNNFNSLIGLNLSIPILNGLQAHSKVNVAKIENEQASFQANTVKIQLRQAIEQDFVNMTTSYETYNAVLEQEQAYTRSFRSAELKYNEGAISTTDYLIVKNNVDKATSNLAAAKYDYIFKTKILDFYLGKPLWP